MLYESVQESIALYNARKKKLQTEQDKLVFRWKFIVIGLGIVLIVLIGILSEIYKEISNRKELYYNTSFLYSILQQSLFLTNSTSIINLMKGLNASTQIIYDNAILLHRSNQLFEPNVFLPKINNKDNLLYLFEVASIADQRHQFGMFLQKKYDQSNIDQAQKQVTIAQSRNHKVSSVFSLQSSYSTRLNFTDSCFLYKYKLEDKSFSLIDVFINSNQQPAYLNMIVNNTFCMGRTSLQTYTNLQQLTGFTFPTQLPYPLKIIRMQIFQLQMRNKIISAKQQ